MGDLVLIPLAEIDAQITRCRLSGLTRWTARLIRALDIRMNSNTVVADLPSGVGPADVRFAAWLDAGAPGLARAAIACDWEGHFEQIPPGPPPVVTEIDFLAFVHQIDGLLTTSDCPYGRAVADPGIVRDGFLDGELEGGAPRWRFYAVDVRTLAPRVGSYFDHFESDHALLWTDGDTLRALFTNGCA